MKKLVLLLTLTILCFADINSFCLYLSIRQKNLSKEHDNYRVDGKNTGCRPENLKAKMPESPRYFYGK